MSMCGKSECQRVRQRRGEVAHPHGWPSFVGRVSAGYV
jgi:hypothetical protein